ncbi:hypothetical protein V1512DRAFT_256171 [Lipomyces arxii]|uniref:uncharacterized protein n=1 Tax=Lipomyces arxii TaxID=56418 RepID=UPI0034CD57AA
MVYPRRLIKLQKQGHRMSAEQQRQIDVYRRQERIRQQKIRTARMSFSVESDDKEHENEVEGEEDEDEEEEEEEEEKDEECVDAGEWLSELSAKMAFQNDTVNPRDVFKPVMRTQGGTRTMAWVSNIVPLGVIPYAQTDWSTTVSETSTSAQTTPELRSAEARDGVKCDGENAYSGFEFWSFG